MRREAVRWVIYETMSILIFIQGYRMCISDMLSVFATNKNAKAVSDYPVYGLCQTRQGKEYMKSCENNGRS